MTALAAEPTWLEQIQIELAEAREERDIALRVVELEDDLRGGWDKKLIYAAIERFAASGRPFSANQVRQVLPADIRTSLMGSRFTAAREAGLIRRVGSEPSRKKNTHYKDIGQWIRARHVDEGVSA